MTSQSDVLYEEDWAVLEGRFQHRPAKRQAKTPWQRRTDVYASRRTRLRNQKIAVFRTEEAGSENEGVENGGTPRKAKTPGKSKVNRLHSFHRQAFGAWLDCDLSAKRDGWTKLNRRYDGGALMKQQFLDEFGDPASQEPEKPPRKCPERQRRQVGHNVQPVDVKISSAATLASLEAVGILARFWPAAQIVQGMRVCKWLRTELSATAQHAILRSVSEPIRKEELVWAKMCGKMEWRDCIASTCQSTVPLTTNLKAVHSLEVTYAFEGTVRPKVMYRYYNLGQENLDVRTKGGMAILRSAMCAPHALVHLDLRGCCLQSHPAFAEIEALGFCARLRFLNLADNALGQPSLARESQLAALGRALAGLSNSLEHLDLSLNDLDADGVSALAAGIAGLKQLQFLSLLARPIGEGWTRAGVAGPGGTRHQVGLPVLRAEGAAFLASVLAHCPRIQHLELGNNLVGDAGALAVASAIAGCTQLRRLGLRRCGLETGAALEVGEMLKGVPLFVDLADNSQLDAGVLLHSLYGLQARWSGLDLSSTHCAPPQAWFVHQVGHWDIMATRDRAEGTGLVSVDLSAVTGPGMYKVLERMPLDGMQRLSLREAELRANALSPLSTLLELAHAIRHLDLNGCLSAALDQAGDDAAPKWEQLAAAMGALPALQSLDLGANFLGTQKVGVLAQVTGGFSALTALSLRRSDLKGKGCEGGGTCEKLLLLCPALRSIDLSDCGIDPANVTGLAMAVGERRARGWPALHLNFRDNPRAAWMERWRACRRRDAWGGQDGWECPRKLVKLLGEGGLSGLELSRGDAKARQEGSRQREWGEDWELACWLFGWRTWAYSETGLKAKEAIATAAANGLRVYSD
mmetsp:Transcript_14866/g.34964  ORF Transcript_14866/g.34964 Transcript_14866/m.34964 type:complete len:861 (-) Transcript_14866:129-2711(-)|eukprot:CAMPEP_0177716464 /NCGR_PEP_ID=MMETSP0484_2-20121128/14524_1 /TAXON_ID=354590 /ORGANISM="Rhodomonas lens, Strain RHODO" /LENGTH=860 /DNA_ID=CAMNT_0019228497 /DNA_START=93 /DNA_END=2675 /DNA_ORIENTATION=-